MKGGGTKKEKEKEKKEEEEKISHMCESKIQAGLESKPDLEGKPGLRAWPKCRAPALTQAGPLGLTAHPHATPEAVYPALLLFLSSKAK